MQMRGSSMRGERIFSWGHQGKEDVDEGSDFGAGLFRMGRTSGGRDGQREGIPGRDNSTKMGPREHVRQILSIQKGSQQRDVCTAANLILSAASQGGFCYRHQVTDEKTEVQSS